MRVFIVDDEAPARSRLRVLLADIRNEFPNEVVGEAANGVEAVAQIVPGEVDVVLADIRMPSMDGIELARHLGRLSPAPGVVFTTAYDQYAVQAFELNAIDYLVKPVRAQRLVAALQKAQRSGPPSQEALQKAASEGRRHFSVGERGRILLVPVADVLYLRAELKYVTARTVEREYVLDESLTHLETEFAETFVRVHRSCLIARRAIAGFERTQDDAAEAQWSVIVRGSNERLPVSRRQWSIVKGAMVEKGGT
jgi:two-component system response regulator AlgR